MPQKLDNGILRGLSGIAYAAGQVDASGGAAGDGIDRRSTTRNVVRIAILTLALSFLVAFDSGGRRGHAQPPAAGANANPGDSIQSSNAANDNANNGSAAEPTENGPLGAIVRVGDHGLNSFLWDFSRANDTDYNGWPDGWDRRVGRRYPRYLDIAIESHDRDIAAAAIQFDSAVIPLWQRLRKYRPSLGNLPPSINDLVDDRYLNVQLRGGLAMVQSVPVPANASYQYRLTCRVRTVGLVHDTAAVDLVFLDSQGRELAVHTSRRIGQSTDWTRVQLSNLHPPDAANRMQVRLRVDGDTDGLEDVQGSIGFDDVLIEQFPQLLIATEEPFGVYDVGTPVTVSARVLGLPAEGPVVRFRLIDADDRQLAVSRIPIRLTDEVGPPIDPVSSPPSPPVLRWRLPRLGPGYYRVAAALEKNDGNALATETSFVVIDDICDDVLGGSFGWSLPRDMFGSAAASMPALRRLPQWLTRLGVRWVKVPCWADPKNTERAEQTVALFGRLQESGVQTVGVLAAPPEHLQEPFELRGPGEAVAARMFRDYSTWHPMLEPVMTRLTLKVRQWQLGDDHDTSFLGRPGLGDQIREIQRGLQGFGQELDIALSWPWIEPLVPEEQSSWQVTNRTTQVPMTATELDAALARQNDASSGAGSRRANRTWVVQNPIHANRYTMRDRIIDLILRMASVKSNPVEAAFVSRPHDPDHGLVTASGRPKPMLLPWRTTSMLIGNLRKIGSLELRSGARNLVFASENRVVMMVWSEQPVVEEIYLGEDIALVDAWGAKTEIPTELDPFGEPLQRFAVGRVPQFIVGVDPLLMRLRMSVRLRTRQLDSILAEPQDLAIEFRNPLSENLAGTVAIRPPKNWSMELPSRSWDLTPKGAKREVFGVILGVNATIGEYELPITFEVERGTTSRVTIYRNVTLGPEGLTLSSKSRFLPNGDLMIQIDMKNESDSTMAFDCKLYPGRGRQYESQFLTVRAGTTATRRFLIRDAEDLRGRKMRLKANELDGPRVLNYVFEVTDQEDAAEDAEPSEPQQDRAT